MELAYTYLIYILKWSVTVVTKTVTMATKLGQN